MSFINSLAEAARTSILSRRWRNLWLYNTCLDFDPTTVQQLESKKQCEIYIAWVNKVINGRNALPGLSPVKEFRIRYELDKIRACYIHRWIDFAIGNQVETLHLDFRGYDEGIIFQDDQFILSEKRWHCPPSRLSSLKCLKSLFLGCVSVSKQFIEFILSSCLLLEDMSLYLSGTYDDLDVSGAPPLQLRRLKIDTVEDFVLTKLCAPYLMMQERREEYKKTGEGY